MSKPPAELKSLLTSTQLPALSQSAIRLLQLSQDPEIGPVEFSVPIEGDPGLASQVLRFVNSSYFGFSREIATVKHAVTLVGIRTVKNFALYSAVFSMMPNPRCGALELRKLWSDSLRRALFARAVAQLVGAQDAEEAFVAALLQDMAIPILAKRLPTEYSELLEQRASTQQRLSQLEDGLFGWNHAQAAIVIAERWKLPAEFTRLIGRHILDDVATANASCDIDERVVAISSLLPALIDDDWQDKTMFVEAYNDIVGSSGPPVESMFAAVDDDYAEFASCLALGKASRSLVDYYHQTIAPAAAIGA